MLLTWINQWLERWTWSEMDHYFDRIHPESIKDINRFMRYREWL